MDGKSKKIASMTLKYIVLIILAVLWVIPIITLVFTAVKSKADFFSGMIISVYCTVCLLIASLVWFRSWEGGKNSE